tara:strand:- start:1562 stop:1675 length:114 start_codon:yes stop_codon:yes gene_type:complete
MCKVDNPNSQDGAYYVSRNVDRGNDYSAIERRGYQNE